MIKTNEELILRLNYLKKDGHADFIRKINKTASTVLGVSMKLLRLESKNVSLNILTNDTLEEQLLKAILLGKCGDIEEIKKFVPYIHDWSVCDCLAGECKFLRKDLSKYFDFVLNINKNDEFSGRLTLVLLNDHFVVTEFVDRVLKVAEIINQDYYYTKMGVAWLLATCFERFPTQTFSYLNKKLLPTWTHNRAIRKICESLKTSSDDKIKIKKLLK